jgi:hypothetical protein
MFPIEIGVKRLKVKGTVHWSRKTFFPGPRTLSFPPRVTILHIWTSHGRKIFPSILEPKGQRSSPLVIKVEICFLGRRMLLFPPRFAKSHKWTMHGKKMFPTEFGVKSQRSSALVIEVEIWFPGCRVCYTSHLESPYHTYGLPWKEDAPY